MQNKLYWNAFSIFKEMLVFWFLSWPLKVHTAWRVLCLLIFTMFLRLYNLSHIFYFKCSPDLKPHPINFLQNVVQNILFLSLSLFIFSVYKMPSTFVQIVWDVLLFGSVLAQFLFFFLFLFLLSCVCVCGCMTVFCFSFGRWWLWWCCCPLPIDQCYCPLPLPIASWASTGERGRWGEREWEATAAVGPILALPLPIIFYANGEHFALSFRGFARGGKGWEAVGGKGKGCRGATFEHHAPQISMYARMHNCFEITTHTRTHTQASKNMQWPAHTCINTHSQPPSFVSFRFT